MLLRTASGRPQVLDAVRGKGALLVLQLFAKSWWEELNQDNSYLERCVRAREDI